MKDGELISKIEKLAELRDRGALTAEEFQAQKSAVLAGINTTDYSKKPKLKAGGFDDTNTNLWAWIIAIFPVFCMIIATIMGLILAGSYTGMDHIDHKYDPLFSVFAYFVPLACFFYLDSQVLHERNIRFSWKILVGMWLLGVVAAPRYILLRGRATNQPKAMFWTALLVWILFSIIILASIGRPSVGH